MFYITAHKVTQNQFANEADNANELANNNTVARPVCIDIPPSSNPHPVRVNTGLGRAIILRPNDLNNPFQKDRKLEQNKDLHEIIIANGLRSHTTSVCSTKSLLSDDAKITRSRWSIEKILLSLMAVIFVLLFVTLITIVCIR